MTEVETRTPVALRTLPDVELAAVGTWRASTGETTFTVADLAGAVAALDCPGVRNPVLKLGHDEEDSTGGVRWDGEPAVGWIANMRLSGNGTKLVGDYTGVPDWLAEVMPSAYPDRSIEIRRPFRCQIGHSHPSVITAVALLGVMPPGVGVLRSLQDVYAAFTVTDTRTVISAAASSHPDGAVRVSVLLPVTVRPARPPLIVMRAPSDAERAAGVDFERVQEQWQAHLDDLLEQWPDITAAQRDELAVQVRDVVDGGEADRLGDLRTDDTDARDLLLAALISAAREASDEQIAEAARQGVTISSRPEPDEQHLEDVAGAVAASMGASLAVAAGRHAAQLLAPGVTGAAVAEQVVGRIDDLSDRFLRDQLGGALSAAQCAGQLAVLRSAPVATYYASELLDANSCAPCRAIDGRRFDSLDDAESAYGSGKYSGCSGGARCRGRLVAVWDTAARASVPVTVRLSIRTSPGL